MPIGRILRAHPTYTRLFVAVAVLVLWGPFSKTIPGGGRISGILFAAVLATAVIEVSPDRRAVGRSLLLGGPAILAQLTGAAATSLPAWGTALVLASTGAFLGYVLALLLKDILSHETVTVETIRGAVTIYLLIGLAWITIYALILLADPGAIAFSDALRAQVGNRPEEYFSILEYFSFVTLTTLGYGDISPVTPVARIAAGTEAVVGQLYIAITIARLVGLQIAASRGE